MDFIFIPELWEVFQLGLNLALRLIKSNGPGIFLYLEAAEAAFSKAFVQGWSFYLFIPGDTGELAAAQTGMIVFFRLAFFSAAKVKS